jgi:hypothetical protein
MTRLLILLTLREKVRTQYYDRLRAEFPQMPIDLVDHHSKVDRSDFWAGAVHSHEENPA